MPAKFTTLDTDDIIKRYMGGESGEKIAASIGVSSGPVYRVIREAGVVRSVKEGRAISAANAPPPAHAAEIVDRYKAGQTQDQIAADLGITQATVSHWVIKAGVQRSRSETERRKWAGMTPETRAAQVASAHDAVRGLARSDEDLERRALSKERNQSHATSDERRMAAWMLSRGIQTIAQKAVGKYNVDLAAEPVAVELFGGGWHAHGDHRTRLPKRTRYLADRGWNTIFVWTHKAHPLGAEVTDELVAYVERSRSDPAFRRQYRVVWGDGKFIAAGSVDDDEVTLVPAGIRGVYGRA